MQNYSKKLRLYNTKIVIKTIIWQINYSIYVTNAPPLVNNTNPETKTEFVLFFSNEFFGIKVDLDGKKKKLPGV